MIVINYSTSFNALDHYIKIYNDSRDTLSEQVRQGASATAKDIIRIYGLSLVKANGIAEVDPDNLPPIRTNNVQLAKMANASPRTIQRHILRLKEAGIITDKIWHGSNSSYELFINPKILLARCRKTLNEVKISLDNALKQSLENDVVNEKHTTTCPHTDSCNNSYINNNLLKGVDNSESSKQMDASGNDSGYNTGNSFKRSSLPLTNEKEFTSYDTGNTGTGYTGEKDAEKIEDAGEKVRIKRAENRRSGDVKIPDPDPARSASLNLYVTLLWSLAKNVLYSGTFLTERQEEIGKKLIFRWYEPVSTGNLSNVHQIYVERVGLVRKFIEKDPEKRFVQLPYKYFNPDNSSGFSGTKKWWEEHEKRKLEVRAKLILHAQIRRFINNERKEPSKRKAPLQLYRECETRVGKLGDPILLEQFHAAILNPTIHQHLYVNN
ncbi:MAG: winged helix-turn-helix domain-containing protein [Cyclobacteriaceae bacterium]|nr:winged helix-turn-helix domain-containing protein [Cyclobacteriaceae bacterium]